AQRGQARPCPEPPASCPSIPGTGRAREPLGLALPPWTGHCFLPARGVEPGRARMPAVPPARALRPGLTKPIDPVLSRDGQGGPGAGGIRDAPTNDPGRAATGFGHLVPKPAGAPLSPARHVLGRCHSLIFGLGAMATALRGHAHAKPWAWHSKSGT